MKIYVKIIYNHYFLLQIKSCWIVFCWFHNFIPGNERNSPSQILLRKVQRRLSQKQKSCNSFPGVIVKIVNKQLTNVNKRCSHYLWKNTWNIIWNPMHIWINFICITSLRRRSISLKWCKNFYKGFTHSTLSISSWSTINWSFIKTKIVSAWFLNWIK